MKQPDTILSNGTMVRTHAVLGSTLGITVSVGVMRRQPNVVGRIAGVVPGHGGDVYWIEHGSGDEAPYCFDEFELGSMSWLEAFKAALDIHWPDPGHRPDGVKELRRVVASLQFTAPEVLHRPARRAWNVYQEEGDTDVGRAAVALTYVIQDERDMMMHRTGTS